MSDSNVANLVVPIEEQSESEEEKDQTTPLDASTKSRVVDGETQSPHISLATKNSRSSGHSSLKIKQCSFQVPESASKLEEFDKKNTKDNKKKGKKGCKWDKSSSYKNLLGFDEIESSPFDPEHGYNLNDLDFVHLTQRPVRRNRAKSVTFSTGEHVQANLRFVLKPNRHQDYFFITYDPDYNVEWDDIFMVLARRYTTYICPICRDEKMVAPVINK